MNETEVEAIRKFAIQADNRIRRIIVTMVDKAPRQEHLVLHGIMSALARLTAAVGQNYPRQRFLELLAQAYDEAAKDKPRSN